MPLSANPSLVPEMVEDMQGPPGISGVEAKQSFTYIVNDFHSNKPIDLELDPCSTNVLASLELPEPFTAALRCVA